MPNWCLNEEIIYGPTEQVKTLYEKLVTWLSLKETEDYPGWLGAIGIGAGMSIDEKDNTPETKAKYFYPRGKIFEMPEIGECDSDTSVIRFASETAWGSCYDCWDRLLAIHAPLCKYFFVSIESGNDVFIRRDPMRLIRNEDYYMNVFICNEDTCPEDLDEASDEEQFWYAEDVMNLLKLLVKKGFLKSKSDNIDELVEEFNSKDWGENYFKFNKITDIE